MYSQRYFIGNQKRNSQIVSNPLPPKPSSNRENYGIQFPKWLPWVLISIAIISFIIITLSKA